MNWFPLLICIRTITGSRVSKVPLDKMSSRLQTALRTCELELDFIQWQGYWLIQMSVCLGVHLTSVIPVMLFLRVWSGKTKQIKKHGYQYLASTLHRAALCNSTCLGYFFFSKIINRTLIFCHYTVLTIHPVSLCIYLVVDHQNKCKPDKMSIRSNIIGPKILMIEQSALSDCLCSWILVNWIHF